MPRKEAFDRHADKYEAWFTKNRHAHLSELEALRQLVPAQARSIEIGMGSGRFALPLGIKLGVEPSAPMRDRAKQRGLQVLDGVAEFLPFRDDTFDLALMVTTICFVDDLRRSFEEAHRILRPGGFLVLGFVDRASSLGKEYEDRKDGSVFYREATFYSAEEVLSLLAETGFHPETTLQTVFDDPAEMTAVQDVRPGHGEGGFVAIQARV